MEIPTVDTIRFRKKKACQWRLVRNLWFRLVSANFLGLIADKTKYRVRQKLGNSICAKSDSPDLLAFPDFDSSKRI
jgi:hypothetical protein